MHLSATVDDANVDDIYVDSPVLCYNKSDNDWHQGVVKSISDGNVYNVQLNTTDALIVDVALHNICKVSVDTRHEIELLLLQFIPTGQFLSSNSDRCRDYSPGKVFKAQSNEWVEKGTPNRLSELLILITFGIFVPLLGFMIVLSLLARTFLTRLMIGQFLVRELSVLEVCRQKDLSNNGSMKKLVDIYGTRLRLMEQAIRDVDKPWGSRAAIAEVEKLCKYTPSSIFVSTKYIYMILATTMYALALNDIYNGAPGRQYASHSIPILAVIIPFVFVLGVKLYERYIDVKKNEVISSTSTTDMDMGMDMDRVC